MTVHTKNTLVVELNEFNYDLLSATVKRYPLPTLRKIMDFSKSSYRTPDRYNSGYLEPWVQWVSIHTGLPSMVHGIKHLGDVPHLNVEQCWETLSRHGVTTGVWGVMNGEKRQAEHALFFLPDPWTFSEWASPAELNHLLRLPRYVAKHYQSLRYIKILAESLKFFRFLIRAKMLPTFLKESLKLFTSLKTFGFQHFIFISYFDYLSTQLFIAYKKKYQPRCAFLFLNSLAHLQHHHWREGTDTATPEILFGLQTLDRTFEALLHAFPDDAIVFHNGLSQMNTNHERPWVLYRQKDPAHFLKALDVPAIRVEQHMTHDGHAFFANAHDCDAAFEAMRHATLCGKPLFRVEKNPSDPCKLFYMLIFTDALEPSDHPTFIFSQKSFSFFEYFDRIVTRTGRHLPIGQILSNTIPFPNHIKNHEFNRYLYHYLLPDKYPISSDEWLEEEESA